MLVLALLERFHEPNNQRNDQYEVVSPSKYLSTC